MRTPRAKSGYQRAELCEPRPFPPPCSAALRGRLSCGSPAEDPGVLAPALLPCPSVLAGGTSPALSPPGLGILVLARKPIQPSCPVVGHHVSCGQGVCSMGRVPGQRAPACINPRPEQQGVQRCMGPVVLHAAHPCRGQHTGTHEPAPLGTHIRAHGCWDPGTGSGSAWAELDAVHGSSQAEQGDEPAPTQMWVLRMLSGL